MEPPPPGLKLLLLGECESPSHLHADLLVLLDEEAVLARLPKIHPFLDDLFGVGEACFAFHPPQDAWGENQRLLRVSAPLTDVPPELSLNPQEAVGPPSVGQVVQHLPAAGDAEMQPLPAGIISDAAVQVRSVVAVQDVPIGSENLSVDVREFSKLREILGWLVV